MSLNPKQSQTWPCLSVDNFEFETVYSIYIFVIDKEAIKVQKQIDFKLIFVPNQQE